MSHCSARITLFNLFLFSCCHQGIWGFYSNRDPSEPSEPSAFNSPVWHWPKPNTQEVSSWGTEAASWKSFNNISFVGKLLSPWLAWLWAGWQQELQHFFFPVLCMTRMDFHACPRLGNLLHPSEAVGSERISQNPYWWARGFIYCAFCVTWKTQMKIPKLCCSCDLHFKRSSSVAQPC